MPQHEWPDAMTTASDSADDRHVVSGGGEEARLLADGDAVLRCIDEPRHSPAAQLQQRRARVAVRCDVLWCWRHWRRVGHATLRQRRDGRINDAIAQ
jgi:hypothetical protein